MGSLLATLGFEWNHPARRDSSSSRESSSTLSMQEEVSNEQLVAEIIAHATRNLYRKEIYRCDLYRGLDERVPAMTEEEDSFPSLWRMNVDHPIVYVLVSEKGQQPIHIVDDDYGALVVYPSDQVEDAIDHLTSLCSAAGYDILNNPVK